MSDFKPTLREIGALLKRDFVSFIERSFYELNPGQVLHLGAYIDLLAAALEDCRSGKTTRLIINLPPRSLKSHIASVAFPAWLMGHDPSTQVICASYGQDLSNKLALDTKKLMQSAFYQQLFSTRLAPEKLATADFMTTDQGGRMATSVGGPLTGRGANWLILDDPQKPDDALSSTGRTTVNNWYDSTLLSRLNDKVHGVIIVIMQRLHQDDLVGHILEREPSVWKVISLPALAEGDETYTYQNVLGTGMFKRKAGEALHPEREGLPVLTRIRENIGEYYFSSQYQQNPIPVGGAVVKTAWLQYYDEPPAPHNVSYVLQSWDTAIKSGELNDYSVCTTWKVRKDKYYLTHVLRRRLEYPDLKTEVIRMAREHGAWVVVIEDKASGSSLLQDLHGKMPCRVDPYSPPPGKDKHMRLFSQSDLFEAGTVLLPRSAPWLADYRSELISFPGSKFDDQVDSTTQALDHLRTKFDRNLAVWERLGRDD